MRAAVVGALAALAAGIAIATQTPRERLPPLNKVPPLPPPLHNPPNRDPSGQSGALGGIQQDIVFSRGFRYAIGVISAKGSGVEGVFNALMRQGWDAIDLSADRALNFTSDAWIGEATWEPAQGVSVIPKTHFEGCVITMLRGPLKP